MQGRCPAGLRKLVHSHHVAQPYQPLPVECQVKVLPRWEAEPPRPQGSELSKPEAVLDAGRKKLRYCCCQLAYNQCRHICRLRQVRVPWKGSSGGGRPENMDRMYVSKQAHLKELNAVN